MSNSFFRNSLLIILVCIGVVRCGKDESDTYGPNADGSCSSQFTADYNLLAAQSGKPYDSLKAACNRMFPKYASVKCTINGVEAGASDVWGYGISAGGSCP